MKCFNCGGELAWQNDFTYEEEGIEEVDGVVHTLLCLNEKCQSTTKVYVDIKIN